MELEKTCRQISKELKESLPLVRDVIMYQFLFTTEVMKDETDYHDILYNELFRFKLKPRYKEDKTKEYKAK